MQAKTPDLSGSETLGLAGFALIIRRDQCRAQYIHTHPQTNYQNKNDFSFKERCRSPE